MAVEGTWNLTLQTPMGVLPATVQLAASGATLSGTMVAVAGEAAIFDAISDGAEVRWSVRFAGVGGEMKLDFAGTVAGDSMDGTVQFGAFGSGGFTGARVADALGTFFG